MKKDWGLFPEGLFGIARVLEHMLREQKKCGELSMRIKQKLKAQ